MSFAVHGWTAPKNPIQASDFRASFVDWLRGSLVDRVVEAVGLSRMVRLGQIPGFLAHDYETGGAQL
jgi:hypothetical protein